MVSSTVSRLSVAFVAITAFMVTANAEFVECGCPALPSGITGTSVDQGIRQKYIQCDYPAGSCIWVDVRCFVENWVYIVD